MNAPDLLPLRLQPEIAELDRLIEAIEAFAERHWFGPADTVAFALAAEELFANTVNHGLPQATSVEFGMAYGDGVATATYSDDGPEFDPTLHPAPDTTLAAAERKIGGLGIHFVRTAMPTFAYARRDGRNIVRFGRRLGRHPEISR